MKRNILFLAITLISSVMTFSQTYHTVDNSPNSTADFTDLNAAIEAASNGDVILVQGSVDDYGDIIVNKQLTIIGPGHHLGQNPPPYTQANLLSAKLNKIQVVADGSGSTIRGIVVNTYSANNYTQPYGNVIGAVNVTFSNCYFKSRFHSASSNNIVLEKSFVEGQASNYKGYLIVRNNVFYTNFSPHAYRPQPTDQVALEVYENTFVANNSFRMESSSQPGTTSNFHNNIVVAPEFVDDTAYNRPSSYNNIYIGETEDPYFSANGNLLLSDPSQVMVGFPDDLEYNAETKVMLTENSPALGTGIDGRNKGAFQENGGYILSGISFTPHIYHLQVNETATQENGLTITLGAQANSNQ